MKALKESPSQTAGPYVHIGCVPQAAGLERRAFGPQLGSKIVVDGTSISLEVTVLDGAGVVAKDALVEIWQADPEGNYKSSERFRNWGRQPIDPATGVARFETLKPGRNGDQAPHILVWIVARGINMGLTTRIYFPDEDNVRDPLFERAGTRFGTMVATRTDTGFTHTIRLQGDEETVFFDV